MELRNLAINTEWELCGVWVEIGDGAQFKIARWGNPAFNKLFTKLSRPFTALSKSGALSEDQAKKIMAETISKTILLDWKGITLDGKELPYSQLQAQNMLEKQEWSELFTLVTNFAQNAAIFRQEVIKTELGELSQQ